MDMSSYKNIHCIGIGGIGLSGLAEILKDKGYKVSGSDMKESEITEKLRKTGIKIYGEHDERNIENADLVVYSAAVSEDNPEMKKAKEQGLPILTRAEMLGAVMADYDMGIAVSGTHGKTTTTSMISLILENARKDPTILVGGNLSEIGGNVKIGQSAYFVTEACEYMDSFLSLKPKVEIILNIDSDHLDYFKDIDHIVNSFQKFAELVSEEGTIIAYDANPFVNNIIKDFPNVISFGFNENCTYYVTDIVFNSCGMPQFYINHKNRRLCTVQLAVPGEHNILNALAAFACCHHLGVEVDEIVATLENYTGTQRRFDIIGETSKGIKVVDDYAHHPTEIRATLAAAGNIPHKALWCIFQPHTYTRTMALFDEFLISFEVADKIIFADIYAAREKNIHKISSEKLAVEIRKLHPDKEVSYIEDFDEIAKYVLKNAKKDDLVITMGAGDIYKVAEIILEKDRNI